jgi:Transposase
MRKRKMSIVERLNRGLLNRNERRKLAGKVTVSDPELTITNPNAAGIDVGNKSHFAAVPPDRDPNPVREFGCWTAALKEMAEWLVGCRIDTVVMQSTGVYWIPLYDILEQRGLRVVVVNARDTRNMPGRKTDVQECQWLMGQKRDGMVNLSWTRLTVAAAPVVTIPMDCCAVPSVWRSRSSRYGRSGGYGAGTWKKPADVYSICRRR